MANISDPTSRSEPRPAILVVEDEVIIRMLLVDELLDAGFHVIEAANADEAVDCVLSQDPIDLVFSDVRMPGSMDGLELAAWLTRVRPDIKILLTSGHLDAKLAVNIATLIPTPYRIADVISKIRAYVGLVEDYE